MSEKLRTNLADDYSISRVIKGGWQMSTGHTCHNVHSSPIDDTLAFIRKGITTLDFGDIYVGVEELVGQVLKVLQQAHGDGVRNSIQLHTKYVPDRANLPNHKSSDTEHIVKRSCSRLGVDTLDLVQFHWWDYNIPGYLDAIQDLAKLQREGVIRNIGVTNFDTKRMQEIVESGVTPLTMQLQYSLLDQRPEKSMAAFCQEHGIHMLAYGTVAGGFLSERYLGADEPSDALENRSLIKYKLIIEEFGGWDLYQRLLQTLKTIADKHKTSISTIASAYTLQKQGVAAVIVGARNALHLEDNLKIAETHLDCADLASIESVLSVSSSLQGDVYDLERNTDRHASIMHTDNNAV